MSEQLQEQAEAVEQPPIEAAADEQPTEQAQADAAVERDVESDVLEIPDSSQPEGKVKYVPASALAGARSELKELKAQLSEAKAGSAKAAQLEARIDDLSAQLAQLAPKAQAFDAAVMAQQQTRREEPAADDSEAIELAQTLDLYTADGKPDVAKAKKTLALFDRLADAKSSEKVAPFARQAVNQAAEVMYGRAKATLQKFGVDMPEDTLRSIWSGVDPSLAGSVEGAKWLLTAAVGAHQLQQWQTGKGAQAAPRNSQGQFAKKEEAGEPLYTEKAGGKAVAAEAPLSDKERQYLKQIGMTEKEYLESAKSAPWLRR